MPPPSGSSPDATPRLAATGLACRRGSRLLFKGLDFSVNAGEIVWLRGQNGGGKTSLLKLSTGLSAPDDGQLLRDGEAAGRTPAGRPRLIYIGHANALKDDLTATEALAFLLGIHARPCSVPDVHAALDRLGLRSRRHALVRTLSQGQRRRVALARLAAERDASLWLLDEPFDALDADGVHRLNGLLSEHAGRGGSVLLTSHLNLDAALLRPVEVDLDRHA